MPRCPHCLKAFRAPIPNMHFKTADTSGWRSSRADCGYSVDAQYIVDDITKVDCSQCLKRAEKRATKAKPGWLGNVNPVGCEPDVP